MPAEPIAHGATADIYAWSDNRILKLFIPSQPRANVEYEYRIGRLVAEAGLNVPQVYDMIEHEGRWGIVYERIDGTVLSDVASPETAAEQGQQMAVLHTSLLKQRVPTLPRQRERFRERIKLVSLLTEAEKQRVLDLLETLPDDTVLCHGDFHPMNVMKTATGLMIIDWTDATQGHFAADVGRTILLMNEIRDMSDVHAPTVPAEHLGVWRQMLTDFVSAYRQEIERRVPEIQSLILRWMPVLAAVRLGEGQYTQAPSSPQQADAQQRLIAYTQAIARQEIL